MSSLCTFTYNFLHGRALLRRLAASVLNLSVSLPHRDTFYHTVIHQRSHLYSIPCTHLWQQSCLRFFHVIWQTTLPARNRSPRRAASKHLNWCYHLRLCVLCLMSYVLCRLSMMVFIWNVCNVCFRPPPLSRVAPPSIIVMQEFYAH